MWRWFCLLVKGTGCHDFLHVLLLLPSHLGSHCSRFVLCYSPSASPAQSFGCVQQIAFHDCYLCEPFKIILLGNCAVSWEMAESGCRVFTALGGTQEFLHCSQSIPCTAELALSQAQILSSPLHSGSRGWWSSSQGSLACWVCLSSVDVPVIALGGQTGCLLLLWLPRKCSVNSTLFFPDV